MKQLPVAGMMVLGLVACGGGSGGGDDFVLSSGVLDLELPTDEERAAFSEDVNTLIDDIQTANETGTAATPLGDLFYSGTWGAGVDDGGALILGSVDGTFSVTNGTVQLNFGADEVVFLDEAPEGEVFFSGSFATGPMVVAGGLYNGAATGSIHTSGLGSSGSWTVDATIDGATVDGSTFGTVAGIVDEVTDESDPDSFSFDGLYIADALPPI